MTRLLLLLLVYPVLAQTPPTWRINGLPPGQLPVLYAYSENTLIFDPGEDALSDHLVLAIEGGTVTSTYTSPVAYDPTGGWHQAITFIPDSPWAIRHTNGQLQYRHDITLLVLQQQYDQYGKPNKIIIRHEIVLDSIILPPLPTLSVQFLPRQAPHLQAWASIKPDSIYAAQCPKDALYFLQGGLLLGQDSLGHWDTLDVRVNAEAKRQMFFFISSYGRPKTYHQLRLVFNPPIRMDSRNRPQPAGLREESLIWEIRE